MTQQAHPYFSVHFRRILSLGGTSLLAGLLLTVLGWMLLGMETAVAAPSSTPYGDNTCFATFNDGTTVFSSGDASAVQTAVDAASPDDLLKIAGTCAGISVKNGISQTVYIDKPLSLQGGYTHTNWLAPADPDTYSTTLDAQRQGRAAVVIGDIEVTLDSLVFTGGGNITAVPGFDDDGAGIWTNATLTLTHDSVISNLIDLDMGDNGGGIHVENGALYMADMLIADNENQEGDGGGISIDASIVSIERATFQNNRTLGTSNNGGGMIVRNNSILQINDTVLDGNYTTGTSANAGGLFMIGSNVVTITKTVVENNATFGISAGGAIINYGGTLTIVNSLIQNNHAYGSYASGGGIGLSDGTLTILNSSVLSNTTTNGSGGGVFVAGDNQVFIQDSTIAHNRSLDPSYPGGGLAFNQFGVNNTHVTLANVTFSGNSSTSEGGAIWVPSGFLTMTHVTLSDNSAITSTGGISVGVNGTVNMANSIIANSNLEDCLSAGTFNDNGYNLVEDGNCITAPSSLSGDPDLAPLADNGGDTLTHALNPASPALNAGDPAYPVIPGDYDQRGPGFPRVSDGRIDIGALEQEEPVCFVETTGDNVTDFSSSNATAVQTAVDAAAPNDLIKIAGTCAGVSETNGTTQTIYISKPLTMQGGYTNTNWLAPSDPDIYPTTLDALNLGRVIVLLDANGNVNLVGLRIQNGHVNDGSFSNRGGGIYTVESSLTLSNSHILSNTATSDGGGIYGSVPLTLTAVTLQENHAGNAGGGLFARNFSLRIDSVNVISNTANDGGGIVAGEGGLITNSWFEDNTANGGDGGALLNSPGGGVQVNNSIFFDNKAHYGGAIHTWDKSVVVHNSEFYNNLATAQGGAIYVLGEGGKLNLSDSVLAGNSAGNGGGIYFDKDTGPNFVRNSTLSGNSATQKGGGLYVKIANNISNANVLVQQTTLFGNQASSGGGVFIPNTGPNRRNRVAGFHMDTSIIAGSSGGDCVTLVGNAFVDLGYNLVEDGSCITEPTSLSGDPMLGLLADNGGRTATLALLLGSPAIDHIPAGSCTLNTDQRDVGRPQNGACDIGAYELWRLNIAIGTPPNLALTWSEVQPGVSCHYDVYEETMPYFTPTTATYLNQSSGVVYPQLGDVVTNYFYVVETVCGGEVTAVSNEVGEFDFAIHVDD